MKLGADDYITKPFSAAGHLPVGKAEPFLGFVIRVSVILQSLKENIDAVNLVFFGFLFIHTRSERLRIVIACTRCASVIME